jgi:hypothetical protein
MIRSSSTRLAAVAVAVGLIAAACTGGNDENPDNSGSNGDTRSTVKFVSGPVPGTGSWAFEETPGGTKMTWGMDFDAHGFFKLAEPVFARMAKRELEASCGHLKDLLESRAQA